MNNVISSPAFQPLYQQIKHLIVQSLVSGEWRPGESIPSEIELASRYNVSQGTVRKAINELADENLLIRQQGKGTFVASHTEERRKYYFLRIVPDKGEPTYPVSELLECKRAKADSATARMLSINVGAPIFVIKRIEKISDIPVMLEEVRLPASRFKGMSANLINQHDCKLYSLYESVYGIRILSVHEQLKAVTASNEEARLLGITSAAPLLSIDRVAFTYGDEPIELRSTLCYTKEHHYHNKIS